MSKKRLSDQFEFTEEQEKAIKRNRLIIYPLLTFLLALMCLFPLIMIAIQGGTISLFAVVPGIFGLILIRRAIMMIKNNRQ